MEKKVTNYKKWSFKFLIYVVLLNILIAYLTAITPIGLGNNGEILSIRITVLSLLILGLLVSGIVLTILSVKNKEEKNYQYKVSIYGYPIFILINLIFGFL
ncbi:hypothetical protein [Tenacibaculum sp. 190524A02b]|uniref:hypothetical protein n=1 Tax=Tenacibaculum vairaonense TaxID=3137860 RepID=UPI0031FB99BD